MTRVTATTWTATVTAAASATLSYKYDLGGTWANVEKNASCADISNRSHDRQQRHGQRHRRQLGRPRGLHRATRLVTSHATPGPGGDQPEFPQAAELSPP